ncbi:putative secreted protein [Wickerhamomyces ciferrii]|uniref:Secreted protein n=1 Tax=Wickerhamomyces ciferrii (strain ATCC 14091 / BCRC 22168 / CBS 111 / JCM 3599 / NBRC 0793 / NRRL Y-1031 F-60-10) TaxID=1206466 RepID=K0KT70_WICCF|nr:uncharacterized protein BN7_4067 [Wickerhamomyces ciferrii]CCH44503.1 putative secreted protein [Wickerhamomyces ciferrii]
MKFSVVLAQDLLLSGIIASPTVFTSDVAPDVVEGSNSDNATDVLTGRLKSKLCFESNQSRFCFGKNHKSCVDYMNKNAVSHNKEENIAYCSFWCSKIKSIDDCRTNKKKFNFHPRWACNGHKYC